MLYFEFSLLNSFLINMGFVRNMDQWAFTETLQGKIFHDKSFESE